MTQTPEPKTPEAQAREIVRTTLGDHDAGGYQFAGVNEILEGRIAAALRERDAEVDDHCRKRNNAVLERNEVRRERDSLKAEVEKLKAALRFYEYPFHRTDEYGDPIAVPDFYDEMDFGSRARDTLAEVEKARRGE